MINIARANIDFPFLAINLHVLHKLEEAHNNVELGVAYKAKAKPVLRTLECFLQITNRKLNDSILQSPAFGEIICLYAGALYSKKIFEITNQTTYTYLCILSRLCEQSQKLFDSYPFPSLKFHLTKPSLDAINCVEKFEKLELNEEKVWLWNAWKCSNKESAEYWAPLYGIYEKFGRDFTQKLHDICTLYYSASGADRIHGLKSFVNFIRQTKEPLNERNFQDPHFMGPFLRRFLTFYFEEGYASGVKVNTLITRWNGSILPFLNTYLLRSDLFAEPYGAIPSIHFKKGSKSSKNIKIADEGYLVSQKLLTDIPLHATDEEAMHLLFHNIKADLDIAITWAEWAISEIWARYTLRLENSTLGKVVKIGQSDKTNKNSWLIDRFNPDHLKNAASTYFHHGHIVDKKNNAHLFLPNPLPQTAYELGLPITGALLPFCIILIANHPQITSSFLEKLQLFDKNGKLVGFVKSDNGYNLISYKSRKGALLAEQIIHLNLKTTFIVQQMIDLTTSLRNHLKKNNDDNWRYLLLTCKRGFSYPARIKRLATDTSLRFESFAESLANTSSLDYEKRLKYALRFSLPALRASCGVLVYLETRSLSEMSKALGHTQLDIRLISRYLPRPILDFFQERWIRIFQAAIVIHAMKDSDLMLEASGFETIDEVDEFLKTHALKQPTNPAIQNSNNFTERSIFKEIVFGVNSEILTVLFSLMQAVDQAKSTVNAKAKYWSEIAYYLINHIETLITQRPDLKLYLDYAKQNSNPGWMEKIIYAK